MKAFYLSFLVYFILSIMSFQSYSQTERTYSMWGDSKVFQKGKIHSYGIEHKIATKSEIDPGLIKKMQLLKNKFLQQSILSKEKNHPKFILPVKLKDGITDDGFYSITSYVDHDTLFPGYVQDYSCGDLSYDLSDGYNHNGTDFFLWPFPWRKMANDEVEVVVAAPGIIIHKEDGNFDQQCEINNDPWNGICILHEDGSTAWYIHMKKNSLIEKEIGEEVAIGEYLGIVGSSGSSLAPHLHFEVYNADGNVVDPFIGPCNQNEADSWWLEQLPYKEAGLNKICTNNHLPTFSECPEEEIPNETDLFYPGDTIYLMSYLRNLSLDDSLQMSISRPDDSIFDEWTWVSAWDYMNTSWLYFFSILKNEQFGIWSYQIKYKGKTFSHSFELKNPDGITDNMQNCIDIFPNPVLDKLYIRSANHNIESVEVYSEIGKILKRYNNTEVSNNLISFDLSSIPKGLLFIKITSDKQSSFEKVLKL